MSSSAQGPVVLPGDPRFGALTRGFNQRWIADPAYVRLCTGPADVVTAVESAVRDGLRITVRSGGHCYENFAYGNTGGVVVDLSLMNGVYVDAGTGWLVVEAGATLVMPWLFATQTLNGSGNPRRGKYKSAYMIGNFTDHECGTIWESLRESGFSNAQALLQVDSYGGRVNAVPSDQTAIPQRSSALKLQYQTYWTHQDGDEENLRWIRDFYTAMYGGDGPVPDGRLDGCYINYPDVDLSNWQTLYYKENYRKLQQVKRRWDPLNIFNHAQSIE